MTSTPPENGRLFLKKIRTYLRACLAYFSAKYHFHKNLFKLTGWKNPGSYGVLMYARTGLRVKSRKHDYFVYNILSFQVFVRLK